MNIGLEGLVILSTILLISYLGYSTLIDDKLEPVKSSIDNKEYLVQDKEDAKDAADLIAVIRQRLVILVEHLIRSYPPDDSRIKMLKDNFNPDSMKEGIDNSGYTSYSINKGEQIVLCLRTNNKLMDINTMMFVVLHELSHIATESIGHTPEFWDNFKWILEESINIGIYQKKDYNKEAVEYCGMTITSSPLE
jgi:predicted metal-dependent hydrolase